MNFSNNSCENKPLISIVVPVYNVELFIVNCLDSLMNQSYKNIEILLINDGSTDKSKEICEEYVKIDGRFKLFNKKNGGLSSARNFGINLSKGKYITFVDSDDFIASDYIDSLYSELIRTNSDISICNFYFYNNKKKSIASTDNNESKLITKEKIMSYLYAHEKILPLTFTVSWGKLYKMNLFESIKFPEGRVHEDEFTTYKLYLNASQIVYISTPLYFYLQRSGSIMNSNYSLSRLDSIVALEERLRILEESNFPIFDTQRSLLRQLAFHKYFLKKNGFNKEYKSIINKYKNLYKLVSHKLTLREKLIYYLDYKFYFLRILKDMIF